MQYPIADKPSWHSEHEGNGIYPPYGDGLAYGNAVYYPNKQAGGHGAGDEPNGNMWADRHGDGCGSGEAYTPWNSDPAGGQGGARSEYTSGDGYGSGEGLGDEWSN
jgi:hypothetical protein